ncbi:hypothetical protein J4230_05780 [Candidatus Woesearchaeota archaeon]|nr:hypothetical protein [Candidatus Woesearchaeota archaeon]
MNKSTKRIIKILSDQLLNLKQPIHLLAVCSGGRTLSKLIASNLRNEGINVAYYEVWTNIIKGKAKLWRTNFTKEDYTGTVVIVEDVIWKGTQLPPIKNLLKIMAPKKRFYIASILDCNEKADFAVYK